jgi:arylsulfatase A-like enzyme
MAIALVIQYRKYEKGNDAFFNLSFVILILTCVVFFFWARILWIQILVGVFKRSFGDARRATLLPLALLLPLLFYPFYYFIPVEARFRGATLAFGSAAAIAAGVNLASNWRGLGKVSTAEAARIIILLCLLVATAAAGNFFHNTQKEWAYRAKLKDHWEYVGKVSLDRDVRLASPIALNLKVKFRTDLAENPFLVFSLGAFEGLPIPGHYAIDVRIKSSSGEHKSRINLGRMLNDASSKWRDIIIDLDKFEGQPIQLFLDVVADGEGTEDFLSRVLNDPRVVVPAWNWREGVAVNLAYMTSPQIVNGLTDDDFNVILISLDTLRADHLNSYGYKRETAPNMAKLAEEGALFTNFFTPATWTLPAHMSLLTALYPSSHRIHISKRRVEGLAHQTIPDLMKSGGYYTVSFNDSLHIGSFYGFDKGFDSFNEKGFGVSENVSKFIDWADEHKDLKFFAFLHTYEVHDYFFRKPEHIEFFAKDYNGKITENFLEIVKFGEDSREAFGLSASDLQFIEDSYDGGILYTDGYIGKLIAALKEMNLYDKTMIMITSDHGESFNESHNNDRHVWWHHGGFPYDSQIHIPLIIKLPKSFENKPLVITQAYSLIDIMPTLAELLRLDLRDPVEGLSMASALKGIETESEERVIITMPAQEELNAILGLRKGQFKYIVQEGVTEELYDLRTDPNEQLNIIDQTEYEDDIEEYTRILAEYLQSCRAHESKHTPGDELPDELRKQLEALGYLHK